jgi:glycosyltransferase involved in cell wall biosynthesis
MLASFLSQTYVDKELIIVNDDVNVTLKCNYDNVTCINLTERLLLPQKRNVGIGAAYGDIIMQHDDDDIMLPDAISTHVKKHMDNIHIWMYRNEASYFIDGESFKIATSSPTVCSYLRSAWYAVGGYNHTDNYGEDVEFFTKMPNKMVERDESDINYVYNWGGIDYHSSTNDPHEIKDLAVKQLLDMGYLGKEYWIHPDYEMYRKFVKLKEIHQKFNKDIKIYHKKQGHFDV